jgi:cytosine/adenosine deaminase-related metal-dependent hydrolase
MFLNSDISGVWFLEYIGNIYKNEIIEKKKGKLFSLAGHAPHTTSPELLCLLKDLTKKNQMPFSIHLAESEDEVEFLQTGKGKWADFLKEREVDFSKWGQFGNTPVEYLYKTGILDKNTIAVHLLNLCEKDVKILAGQQANACLCARSNLFLHNRLPDIYMMKKAGVRMCIGTDSLASCNSLNLFEEMKFLVDNFPDLLPEDVLSMATINGAIALGIENRLGDINKKKRGSFIYVPVKSTSPEKLIETIVYFDFNGMIEAIGFK